MTGAARTKGPWTQRILVTLLTIASTVLLYWLLDFATGDIGSTPGPDWTEYERVNLDPQAVKEQQDLTGQAEDIQQQIEGRHQRQELLRRSTDASRETMNQLLEIQRLALQKSVKPSEAEQAALADSQQLFLQNQRAFQGLNDEIVGLSERAAQVQTRIGRQSKVVEDRRVPMRAEFDRLARRHELRMAALKLAFLLPLLAAAAYAFLRWRAASMAPLVYAAGIAVLAKVAEVVHEYFPSRYFKYVALLAVLAVVVKLLVALLRAAARPGRDWLLKRYREAYEQFRCPRCDFPIRRGPLRFLLRTRRGGVNLGSAPTGEADPGPYTCPACGVAVYEECGACHAVRPSLLPWCDRCGAEKVLSS
jgi:hypothetical protein